MKRRTKIVCTLGPASATKEAIRALIEAGMNVARINCSHGDWEARRQWVSWIRELSSDISPVGILADLQGPKFRIGEVSGGILQIKTNQTLMVGPESSVDIRVEQPEIIAALTTGSRLLLGDGNVELRITKAVGKNFEAKAASAGEVKSHQGITLVGKSFPAPCITPKDLEDIQEGVKAGVDFFALSYVRGPSDMLELRRITSRLDPTVHLVAKIETKEAVDSITEIIKVSDAVMVARGDMGLQVSIEDVPIIQKRIIERATTLGKPVITATQMLESMCHSPRPTRAEATDVANAILDGTDAVMLSGETASGDYPVLCVRTMSGIAERAEQIYDRQRILSRLTDKGGGPPGHTEAIAHAVNELSQILKPAAILTTSTSGQTPRLVSKFRPKQPILCATLNSRTQAQLALVWGVESVIVGLPKDTDQSAHDAIQAFCRKKRLKVGDTVIFTAGAPAGRAGNTNLIMIQTVE
ncbi:MAG: pyruvate kinase [Armatimonadetes bacterium]|nr:pyruvate kinase [Armatimonadota bacterium]